MKRFEELEVVGDGAFGTVTKCRDRETGELVAIKRMKKRFSSFDECLQLKEVKSLRKIKHINVVKLLQVFRENEYLYLVFELMGKSLLKTINETGGYTESEVRGIMKQILTGLSYIHRQGFFHRDMKPDNVLWKDDVLKIADFGLAREIRSRPPFTEYVSTRWYRAPEIILRSENYNSPVDIWAAAAIMAELYTARPLFQGNSETDQLYKICAILGPPNQNTWPDGIRLATKTGFRFMTQPGTGLAQAVPRASKQALDLMNEMLRFDPAKRPSATQALQHPFFSDDDKYDERNNNIAKNNNQQVNNSFENTSLYTNSNTQQNYNSVSNDIINQNPKGYTLPSKKEENELDQILSSFMDNNSNNYSNTYNIINKKESETISGKSGYTSSLAKNAAKASLNTGSKNQLFKPRNKSSLAKPVDPLADPYFDIDDDLFSKY